jgi:hypothetical protein
MDHKASKICPKCLHKANEQEIKFSPLSCPRCGCLYSARDIINEEKRQKNETLKAWRITRWRAKNGRGLIFGIPAFMVIMYVIYQFGHFVIANSRPIANEVYQITKKERQIESTISNNSVTVPVITASDKAFLTVSARKTITLLLIHQTTNKKIGPILIDKKPEKIALDRGDYTALIIDNGKKTIKSLSFLGSDQELEF